jgi:hypothetical protein
VKVVLRIKYEGDVTEHEVAIVHRKTSTVRGTQVRFSIEHLNTCVGTTSDVNGNMVLIHFRTFNGPGINGRVNQEIRFNEDDRELWLAIEDVEVEGNETEFIVNLGIFLTG